MLTLLFDNLGTLAIGGAAVVGTVVAMKGVPASWAWLSAKWNAGKVELASLKGDVANAQTAAAAIEGKLTPRITALEAEVAALKAKLPA
jgi:hypothetical protein